MPGDEAILTAIENLRSDVREDVRGIHTRMDGFITAHEAKHNGVDLKELKKDVSWLKNKYLLFIGGSTVVWAITLILVEVLT